MHSHAIVLPRARISWLSLRVRRLCYACDAAEACRSMTCISDTVHLLYLQVTGSAAEALPGVFEYISYEALIPGVEFILGPAPESLCSLATDCRCKACV